MRLVVATPTAVVVDAPSVSHLRAEDASGSFGVQPGHADLLTELTVSVVTYRDPSGTHHVAVRGGILRLLGGDVAISTREAAAADDLKLLESEAIARLRREATAERVAMRARLQLEGNALRLLYQYLRPEGGSPHA